MFIENHPGLGLGDLQFFTIVCGRSMSIHVLDYMSQFQLLDALLLHVDPSEETAEHPSIKKWNVTQHTEIQMHVYYMLD